jgi:hypothetical protein
MPIACPDVTIAAWTSSFRSYPIRCDARWPAAPGLQGRPKGRAAYRSAMPIWTGAAGYAFTRSPDVADLSMAAMTSWRRTASAKSGTVCVRLSMSAANAA